MDLIYTNVKKEDVGVLLDFTLDLAFGSDENDFALTVIQENHVAEAGCFIYIQGTEYGGLIDAITSDTGAKEVTYSGRTWHGLLNSKIIEHTGNLDYPYDYPFDYGGTRLIVSGDANTIIGDLITQMGLTALFTVNPNASDITVNRYTFDRYCPGYDGIAKMLASVGAKLHIEHNGTNVVLSAVPIVDYTEGGIDNDQMTMIVKKTTNKVNHLICLGAGELANRTIVHLYADGDGNISQQQTFTGVNEYAATYDNSNAEDEEKLIEGGTERFEELLNQDNLSVDFVEVDDNYDVGDIVGATDNITGITISVPVTKKIVRIEGDNITIDIETSTKN